jgi:transposase-like protein
LRKQFESVGGNLLREMVQAMAEALMGTEVDNLCGTLYGQGGVERVNHSNGHWGRRLARGKGRIDLVILRPSQGQATNPEWLLDPRRRSAQSLVPVVTELLGMRVSTYLVEELVQAIDLDLHVPALAIREGQ